MKRAIIFSNGNRSDFGQAKKIISPKDYLIAADGAVSHILKLGLIPQIVIGDFDSISTNLKKKLQNLKIKWIKYPTKKDKTDFELALDLVLEKKYNQIIVFGILGDRIDHFLANILLLTKKQTENKRLKIKIIEGNQEIFVLNKEIIITGQIGDEVSLIPLKNNLKGVRTEGLQYRLNNKSLFFGSTRGISNIMTKTTAKITVVNGTALLIHRFTSAVDLVRR